MDVVTKVTIETIGDAGYRVDIAGDGHGGMSLLRAPTMAASGSSFAA